MKKTLQLWGAFILILFLFPIILNFLPSNGNSAASKQMKEPLKIVYASNVFEEEMPEGEKKKALLYFTHNDEAFEPVTEAKTGKLTAFHQSENITIFGEKLQSQLAVNGVQTEILPVDNSKVRAEQNASYARSYHTIRPFVKKQVKQVEYDLIIDLHRDSIKKDLTTVKYNGEYYARVAFVVGLEHPNYKQNEEKTVKVKAELEKLVPGITRGIIRKGGPGVDGKYNQDLHPNLILIELGGFENNESELNRTIAVLAEALTIVLNESDAGA